jgi:glycosyltransferase involved in cell wall biosynthesis
LLSDHTNSSPRTSKLLPPKEQNQNSILLRELASIHRSDLTLVCSPYELDLLQNKYNIPSYKLALASFFVDSKEDVKDEYFTTSKVGDIDDSNNDFSFENRVDFVTLGGFKHPPNIDQVKVLKHDIWPQIRKQIPNANLFIYGAYAPHAIQKLHDERTGFHVKGHASSLMNVLTRARVMLAPLRFGAGIKGKIIDSWKFGCPVVTTPIGSEGMTMIDETHQKPWGGIITSNSNDFVQGAVDLYKNKSQWIKCQNQCRSLLDELFDAKKNLKTLDDNILVALHEKESRRQRDYFSAILWSQQARSTEFFSRWIEQKEVNASHSNGK